MGASLTPPRRPSPQGAQLDCVPRQESTEQKRSSKQLHCNGFFQTYANRSRRETTQNKSRDSHHSTMGPHLPLGFQLCLRFNAALGACEKAGQWRQVVLLLSRLASWSLEPDEITYNSAISACETLSFNVFGIFWSAFALQIEMATQHLMHLRCSGTV